MQTSLFSFNLPEHLIARHPPARRGASRLMVLSRRTAPEDAVHTRMDELPRFIRPGTVMVFNDTRVRKSRLFARNTRTGAEGEFLFLQPAEEPEDSPAARPAGQPAGPPEQPAARPAGQPAGPRGRPDERIAEPAETLPPGPPAASQGRPPAQPPGPPAGRSPASSRMPGRWECIVNKAKRKRIGGQWRFPGGVSGTIVSAPAGDRRVILLDPPPDERWFETHGRIPLPPYMRRPDEPEDAERYQTVYARHTGSAAAPTAGLHFTPELMDRLTAAGIRIAWVTLQVGLGTFAPVRSELITDHRMHAEVYSIPPATAALVESAKKEGRPVLAVGTTSVRSLEAAWSAGAGRLQTGEGSTSLFIHPGRPLNVVNALFTNFHTPRSSLLMLVSAFYGREKLLNAYRIAVENQYRFFSYGDAMLIIED